MKKNMWLVVFNLVLIAAFALSSCQAAGGAKKIKVGLVTDVGGVNDKSFNQSAWAGVTMAAK